jgi:hypothetical protein
MPKTDVDYSNTIIYKIYCKDKSVNEVYIGHTTNFVQRKYAHKTGCNNFNNTLNIYNIIRCNGGWDNWDMVEIAKYNCKDATEARIKEQEHYEKFKSSLNSCPPYVDKKQYFCNICHLQCKYPSQYNTHMKSDKHIKNMSIIKSNENMIDDNIQQKMSKMNTNKFICELCDYKCCKKYNLDRHILSSKHQKQQILSKIQPKMSENEQTKNFSCENCGKEYTNRTGLWRHKQKCSDNIYENKKLNELDKDDLIKILIEQNAKLMSILENGTHNTNNNTTNNTHTNSHNKAFNLNFFLNETCKNAMNITDFVDSIKLQLSDLMDVGELGYIEGISKIIVKNLNNLDETIRPIHCTDKKRETMYIKDENQWEKEDENKTRLKKDVNKIADKNIRLLPQFREKYPDYNNSSSKTSDKYDKIVVEAMTSDETKNEKIIKNISNATIINKS